MLFRRRIVLALLTVTLATLATSGAVLVVIAALVAAPILAFSGGAWYARRRSAK
ncbi:MAG: hypothetical protein IIC88_04880 [Chloroflexi bacterium]|nr:hypothetical protein [Chloroflexota bacterium]